MHPQVAENCDASMILPRPSADTLCIVPCTKREIKDSETFSPLYVEEEKHMLLKMRGDAGKNKA